MEEKFDLKSMIVEETEEEKKPINLSSVMPTTLTVVLNVRVLPETKKSLDEMAEKYNISVSEVVRQLTKQGLDIVNPKK